MAATNYALTSDETAALDAALATPRISVIVRQASDAEADLAGLSGDDLAWAQSKADRLTTHRNVLLQDAYSSILLERSPPEDLGFAYTITRQTIDGTDTLIATSA